MSKTIVAFGASNSKQSINKQFANFAAQQIADANIELLDLNDFEMPIYSIDREKTTGIPTLAADFKNQLKGADGLIISFAEHNGAYSAAFKNIMDWVSRMEGSIWENKPMLLLSTSPGGRGGLSVLNLALNSFKHMNKNVLTGFALPSFNQNFSKEEGITNQELLTGFNSQLQAFVDSLTGE